MEWSSYFTILMALAVIGIPWYRLETIRYTEIYNGCYESWEKDQELDGLHICSIPAMRERYRGRVDCEGAKKSTLLDPRDCAYRQWCATFWPVKTFNQLYESLSGTWYVYALTSLLLVVLVYTWVNSRASVEKRRLELKEQREMFREFSNQFLPRASARKNEYALPYRTDDRQIVYVNKGERRTGGVYIEEYD